MKYLAFDENGIYQGIHELPEIDDRELAGHKWTYHPAETVVWAIHCDDFDDTRDPENYQPQKPDVEKFFELGGVVATSQHSGEIGSWHCWYQLATQGIALVDTLSWEGNYEDWKW